MSSFLKPELSTPEGAAAAETKGAATPIPVTVTPQPPGHVPNGADVAALVEAAHEHIETLVSAELANVQKTLSAAWRASEEALAQARAELDDLRKKHEALKVLSAENERKLAVLEEVKKKLAGL